MNKATKEYFETYPDSIEVFETTDGFLFHRNHDAATHAKTQEDKAIVRHERPASLPVETAPPAEGQAVKESVAPVTLTEAGEVLVPGKEQFTTTDVADPADITSILPPKPTGQDLGEGNGNLDVANPAPSAVTPVTTEKPLTAAQKKKLEKEAADKKQ
jgi:hypothetical protein